jgi:hypothetical protein
MAARDGKNRYWHLRSLAVALAGTPDGPPWWLDRAIVRGQEMPPDEANIRYKQFLVDFSPIDEFEGKVLATANPLVLSSQHKQLEGKIVIIGRGVKGTTLDAPRVPPAGS